jgi:hypothetical protein
LITLYNYGYFQSSNGTNLFGNNKVMEKAMNIFHITKFGAVLITALLISGCGGSSSTTSSTTTTADSGTTLTGTVDTFTASLVKEKKSFYVRIKEYLLSKAVAATSDVTVTVGDDSTTTASDGTFTLSNISTGDQTVTFTQGSTSATYLLDDIDESETYTLNDVSIADETVSTANTGVWIGTITMGDGDDDVEYDMTLTISAGGNAFSGTLSVDVDGGESGTFSGTENGSTIEATYSVTGNSCTLTGPITGTFSDDTLEGNAPVTTDTCGLEAGDEDEDGHAFTLTKQ